MIRAIQRYQSYKLERAFVGFLILIVLLAIITSLTACSGTVSAYLAAEGHPDRIAYVIAEQYAAILHEAAILKNQPTTPPEAVDAMQKADLAAQPFVAQLRPASEAWAAAQNATTEAELQTAIDQAAVAVAAMVDAVKRARGDTL